jgi:hypothetical protein
VNKNRKVKDWTDDPVRMNFVGLDLHKNYIQAAVVDRRGRVATEERIEKWMRKSEDSSRAFQRQLLETRS